MQIPKLASKIDLSNKNLTEIPSEIFECRNLKTLNLSHNNLKSLPKELSKLKFLKNLDLSNNKISQLYAKFFDLKNLEVLNLNQNQLKKIPEQIGLLKKLKMLSVSSNNLNELPKTFSLLQNLNTLNISSNSFTDFPEEILGLLKLKYLWIGNNYFKSFPSIKQIQELKELKYLYVFNPSLGEPKELNTEYEQLSQIKGNSLKSYQIINNDTFSRVRMDRKNIFISYSHKDEHYFNEINSNLKSLDFIGVKTEIWSDIRLEGGDLWKKEIDNAILKAGIAINIISSNYMASRFIKDVELPMILNKAKSEGMVVLNIIVRKCMYKESILGNFQSVNDPDKPLNGESESSRDNTYYIMNKRIHNILK